MPDPAGRIDEILDRWLERAAEEMPEGKRGADLLESYRALARFILERELGPQDAASDEEELDRLLASVARSNRKSSMNISSTLASFGHLSNEILSEASADDVSEEAVSILRATMAVDRALARALGHLVRIHEEAAERSRKERANALSAMMDVLSHELDNRLGAARTATDMLDSPNIELDEEDLRRVSRLVRSSLDDAFETVDDVKALVDSWGDESVSSNAGQTMPLSTLAQRLIEELDPVAREAGVRLVLDPGPKGIEVDAPRARLILYNLVSNGIKYRDPRSDDAYVAVSWESLDDGRIQIRVADDGLGIAAEDHEEIFLYRTRVEEEIDGSGLGLAIAREAVEQLGGELTVESALGEGSTFTVTLRPPS